MFIPDLATFARDSSYSITFTRIALTENAYHFTKGNHKAILNFTHTAIFHEIERLMQARQSITNLVPAVLTEVVQNFGPQYTVRLMDEETHTPIEAAYAVDACYVEIDLLSHGMTPLQ